MTREELFQWVKQEYGTEAEYPWKDSNAVLRRADNDKWYGVILSVAGSKLGLEDDNIIDVINLKSDPMLIGSLRGQKGYFPAYHMNKEKWISVLLGDAGLDGPIKNLLALSYELTAPKKKKNTSPASVSITDKVFVPYPFS